jgi:hypothetical protein
MARKRMKENQGKKLREKQSEEVLAAVKKIPTSLAQDTTGKAKSQQSLIALLSCELGHQDVNATKHANPLPTPGPSSRPTPF